MRLLLDIVKGGNCPLFLLINVKKSGGDIIFIPALRLIYNNTR